MPSSGGGHTTVTNVDTPEARALQAAQTQALLAQQGFTGGMLGFMQGQGPGTISGLQGALQLSPGERALPGSVAPAAEGLTNVLQQLATDTSFYSRLPVQGLNALQDVGQRAVRASDVSDPLAEFMRGMPGRAGGALDTSILRDVPGRVFGAVEGDVRGTSLLDQLAASARGFGAPLPSSGAATIQGMMLDPSLRGSLDSQAVLAPLERAFSETVAPEIRASALRAGAPGGSGESALFERAAGDFSERATEALARQELSRRSNALSALQAAAATGAALPGEELSRRGIELQGQALAERAAEALGTTDISRRGLAVQAGGVAERAGADITQAELQRRQAENTAANTAAQYYATQRQQQLEALGIERQAAQAYAQAELQGRSIGLQGLSQAGQLAQGAYGAAIVPAQMAAQQGAAERDIGLQRSVVPLNIASQILKGTPSVGLPSFGGGTRTTTETPSIGAQIGGGIEAGLGLNKLWGNLGIGGILSNLFGGGAAGGFGGIAGTGIELPALLGMI